MTYEDGKHNELKIRIMTTVERICIVILGVFWAVFLLYEQGFR